LLHAVAAKSSPAAMSEIEPRLMVFERETRICTSSLCKKGPCKRVR
jgi:hypothetical protein